MVSPTALMIHNTLKKTNSFRDLFSEPFITRFPDVKAFEMLEKMNAVFVFMPEPDFCYRAAYTTAGRPPYIVKFKTFSDRSFKAVDNFVSKNPFFELIPEISGENVIHVTHSYSVLNELNYNQFVDIVEAHCNLLQKQNGIVVKRFKMDMDLQSTGKMQFTALEKGETFFSLLTQYRGEADLYDDSFNKYAWDLMSENNLFTEYTDGTSESTT